MKRQSYAPFIAFLGSIVCAAPVAAQADDELNVLIVVAHPDDDAMFAATVYKITHTLAGNVDLALITDGSGQRMRALVERGAGTLAARRERWLRPAARAATALAE